MKASMKWVQNQSKSEKMKQAEQVQNLFASLFILDNASFINLDAGSPFAINHVVAEIHGFTQNNPQTDNSVETLFKAPEAVLEAAHEASVSEKFELSDIAFVQPANTQSIESFSSSQSMSVHRSDDLWPDLSLGIEKTHTNAETTKEEFSHQRNAPFDVIDHGQSEGYAGIPLDQGYGSVLLEVTLTKQASVTTGDWNSTSGWGQVNVIKSLELANADYSSTYTHGTPNAPAYLSEMGFTAAWANGFTGKGVVIADIDTGFDFKNNYLTQGIEFSSHNWNFINNSNNVQDDNGHGTMTASEMVANPHTGFGIWGASYSAELMVLKALDSSGKGSVANVCGAIYYAVDHGADVINMSLGQNLPNAQLQSAMQYASSHDVVVVAAAGNNAGNSPSYPAAYGAAFSNVIAVGASENHFTGYELASFSNHAGSIQPYNFVTANGVDIIGFGINNTLWSWTGTSISAPLVAAQAAILESANKSMTASQIIQAITGSADNLDKWLNSGTVGYSADIYAASSHSTPYDLSLSNTHETIIQNVFPIEHVY